MKNICLKCVGENGDEAEVIPSKFIPLTFADLFPSNDLFQLQGKVEAGDTQINGKIIDEKTTFTMPTEFKSKMSVYAIVAGGWLPITFRNSNWVLPDRNLISSIIQIKSKNLNSNNKDIEWWLNPIKNSNITIHPMLYALEGNKQKKPSYKEFCTSFDKAVEKLSGYFPKEKIISCKSEECYRAGYSILEEITARQDDEINFLLETVPLVLKPYSDRQIGDNPTKNRRNCY